MQQMLVSLYAVEGVLHLPRLPFAPSDKANRRCPKLHIYTKQCSKSNDNYLTTDFMKASAWTGQHRIKFHKWKEGVESLPPRP